MSAFTTMTKSPVSSCGVYCGLCLPRRTCATSLARRPSGLSVASTTHQARVLCGLRLGHHEGSSGTACTGLRRRGVHESETAFRGQVLPKGRRKLGGYDQTVKARCRSRSTSRNRPSRGPRVRRRRGHDRGAATRPALRQPEPQQCRQCRQCRRGSRARNGRHTAAFCHGKSVRGVRRVLRNTSFSLKRPRLAREGARRHGFCVSTHAPPSSLNRRPFTSTAIDISPTV